MDRKHANAEHRKQQEASRKEVLIKVCEVVGNSFAGSRYAGEVLRRRIDEVLNRGSVVVLDFDGITGITQGFGDEILGVYVRAFGPSFVRKNMRFSNLHSNVRQILRWVWAYSVEWKQKHGMSYSRKAMKK